MKPVLHAVILAKTVNDSLHAMTLAAADSLRRSFAHRPGTLSITIVESNRDFAGSGYAYPDYVRLLVPDEPFNFNRFLNLGLESVTADYYALCNNDIDFAPDWFDAIERMAGLMPEVGSFSPMCPDWPRQQSLLAGGSRPVIMGYRPSFELSGWCIVLRQATWRAIGPFDEAFRFYFADDDYAMTLRAHNIRHALVPASHVRHLEHQKTSHQTDVPGHDVAKPPSGLPLLLRFRRYRWLTSNPGMLDGYLAFSRKWGNMLVYALRRTLHDATFLRLGLKWPTRLIIPRP
ncbi:MAG: hypothetical protein EP335_11210 [Alphaproteobacteria bacterium]|nr:MAG: hypothetical protein EP335_11210 [Alphaproteobacteria bacterium]